MRKNAETLNDAIQMANAMIEDGTDIEIVCVEIDGHGSADYDATYSLSSMWGDANDAPVPEQRIADLGQIWDAAHRSFRDIATAAGISVRQLAMRYAIPRRTAEDWSAGKSAPQLHEMLAIQQCEGLLTVRRA